ncbi:MAG: acyl-CoA thioesterase [Candidatus Eiseniibacteriota bacterium]
MSSAASPTPKPASESATEMVQLVLPDDTNTIGNVLGGTVMHWIDVVAAITAHRHARKLCVTASMDDLSFEAPIRMGQLAILKARVTHTSRTSLEVQVDVESEDLNSTARKHTSTAFLTFVAIDENGAPVPVTPLLVRPEDEEEHARAEARRKDRLRRRAERSAVSAPATQPARGTQP